MERDDELVIELDEWGRSAPDKVEAQARQEQFFRTIPVTRHFTPDDIEAALHPKANPASRRAHDGHG